MAFMIHVRTKEARFLFNFQSKVLVDRIYSVVNSDQWRRRGAVGDPSRAALLRGKKI